MRSEIVTLMPERRHNEVQKQPQVLRLWQWGFSILALLAGIWLLIENPNVGAVSGRTLGLILIGYAVLRTLAFWLAGLRGSKRETLRAAQDGDFKR